MASITASALRAAAATARLPRVVGESGPGLVRATLRGDGRLESLFVSPMLGKHGSRAVERHVANAVNRAQDRLREQMGKVLRGESILL